MFGLCCNRFLKYVKRERFRVDFPVNLRILEFHFYAALFPKEPLQFDLVFVILPEKSNFITFLSIFIIKIDINDHVEPRKKTDNSI